MLSFSLLEISLLLLLLLLLKKTGHLFWSHYVYLHEIVTIFDEVVFLLKKSTKYQILKMSSTTYSSVIQVVVFYVFRKNVQLIQLSFSPVTVMNHVEYWC